MDEHARFSFDAALLDDQSLPDRLRDVLESWVDEFSADAFAAGVSSKGVKAFAIKHEEAVKHQDLLVERLRKVLHELAAL